MYYTLGAGDLVELRTPGYVLSEMQTVNTMVNNIYDDIAAQGFATKDPAFARAYQEYVKEWRAFYDENKSGFGGWWARGTTPIYNKTEEFKNRTLDWAQKFKTLGGKVQAILPPRHTQTVLGLKPWQALLAFGGAAALVWYVTRKM